ncbi:hypothetical protein J437_LFUL008965 [Ladona fulva]|uniref:Integrin alpha-2 domain-containing protein n=1 Tax=Ladona fulva TaxID=123851 RepID=A0A8K0KEW7_LADFU|nr:hypothetical protein J437_LFUL008965 [Ladona fulva]
MFPRVVPLLHLPENCQEKPANDSSSFSILLCEVGNPLLKNETRYIILEFDTTSIPLDMEALNYTFETESVGEKMSEEDGRAEIFIPLTTVADISIIGRSSQRNFYLQKQNKSEVDKIYSFSHVYEVTNYGPSPVDQIKLTFKFPTQIVSEDGCMTFLRVYSPEVFIFDFPLQEEQSLVIRIELIGTQMGEYFGYSICVADLNNDGLDDLVVGAPQYSLEQSGTILIYRSTGIFN